MKFAALIFFSLLMLLPACSRRDAADGKFGWKSVSQEFDSIARGIESTYILTDKIPARDTLTDALWEMARRHPSDRAMQIQATYWMAIRASIMEDDAHARALLIKAAQMTDSARFPYELARIRSKQATLKSTPIEESYRISRNNLEVYEQMQDSFMRAATLLRLGHIMSTVSDTVGANTYYEQAEEIYQKMRLDEYATKNLLNVATTLSRPETFKRRDSIMAVLRRSPMARQDPSFYPEVLLNSFIYTGQFPYLRQAYEYVGRHPGREASLAFYESLISDYYLENNLSLDSMAMYARRAFARLQHVTTTADSAVIYKLMSQTMRHEGKLDSALFFSDRHLHSSIADQQNRFSAQIILAENQNLIHGILKEEEARRYAERSQWFIISLIIILAALGIFLYLYFRLQRARLRSQKAEVELQRNSNHLSAFALDMDRKDTLIESILKDVETLADEGKIRPPEAKSITATIRHYLTSRIERDSFQQMHQKLHPEFRKRLKQDYPNLGESQVKLASYICIGMTNKQIAQAMNIEYDSVKKSRYRLRSKMGLHTGDSLEDALRAYSR